MSVLASVVTPRALPQERIIRVRPPFTNRESSFLARCTGGVRKDFGMLLRGSEDCRLRAEKSSLGMLAREEVIDLVRKHLGIDATRSGSVLYNGWNTLRPGRVYLMGLNPGGEPHGHPSILESLAATPAHHCAYTDECWGTPPRLYARGQSPHQRRVCELVELLGQHVAAVFAANAIFVRSVSGEALSEPYKLWAKCWPVHQVFLGIVRPKIVLCLGIERPLSAFELLRLSCGAGAAASSGGSSFRDGKWFDCRLTLSDGSLLPVHAVGAPHPSRFGISEALRAYLQSLQASGP